MSVAHEHTRWAPYWHLMSLPERLQFVSIIFEFADRGDVVYNDPEGTPLLGWWDWETVPRSYVG